MGLPPNCGAEACRPRIKLPIADCPGHSGFAAPSRTENIRKRCSRTWANHQEQEGLKPRFLLSSSTFAAVRNSNFVGLSRRKQGFESPRERQGSKKPRQNQNNCYLSSLSLPRWYHWVGSIMRVLMGVIKDRHGTYCARRKVPKGLEEAVAVVLGNGKQRQKWLKRP
jgi:hypothetical protein